MTVLPSLVPRARSKKNPSNPVLFGNETPMCKKKSSDQVLSQKSTILLGLHETVWRESSQGCSVQRRAQGPGCWAVRGFKNQVCHDCTVTLDDARVLDRESNNCPPSRLMACIMPPYVLTDTMPMDSQAFCSLLHLPSSWRLARRAGQSLSRAPMTLSASQRSSSACGSRWRAVSLLQCFLMPSTSRGRSVLRCSPSRARARSLSCINILSLARPWQVKPSIH